MSAVDLTNPGGANPAPVIGGRWLKLDCCEFRGDRPCAAGVQGVCPADCAHYRPMGQRILVIKVGALGDVIRTAALLPGLKEAWPQSQITWVTQDSGVRMLANHPQIDRLLPFGAQTACHLEHERFDLCLSLDKEAAPAALAMRVSAGERRGIGLSPYGTPYPLNPECVRYFTLGLDDELKFRRNRKSYPELVYEAVGLRYRGQRHRLYPGAAERARAAQRWRVLRVDAGDVVVGLNTGAGHAFANKNWPAEKLIALARRLAGRDGWRVALLGGPEERERNAGIVGACPGTLDAGCDHAELEFAALVERCDVLLTGDTMALHVADACDVPCVALFGPTCAQEIELHGGGEKILTSASCAPCYRRQCDRSPNCMDAITVEQVLAAIERCAGSRGLQAARRKGRGSAEQTSHDREERPSRPVVEVGA